MVLLIFEDSHTFIENILFLT